MRIERSAVVICQNNQRAVSISKRIAQVDLYCFKEDFFLSYCENLLFLCNLTFIVFVWKVELHNSSLAKIILSAKTSGYCRATTLPRVKLVRLPLLITCKGLENWTSFWLRHRKACL